MGVYFSKPDWTTPYFWWPYYPPKDRNPSYDITKYPDRWKKFVEFTRNQINEGTTEYGKVDILWLDGCWVLPLSKITEKLEEFCKYPHDMDIDMKSIAERARASQPGMLVVDRWVQGEYENYLTPGQTVPAKALTVPWDSCITMGNAWGWVKDDKYKSSKELVQLLVNIVAKGGNLLLGVGLDGKGEFEPKVYEKPLPYRAWWFPSRRNSNSNSASSRPPSRSPSPLRRLRRKKRRRSRFDAVVNRHRDFRQAGLSHRHDYGHGVAGQGCRPADGAVLHGQDDDHLPAVGGDEGRPGQTGHGVPRLRARLAPAGFEDVRRHRQHGGGEGFDPRHHCPFRQRRHRGRG